MLVSAIVVQIVIIVDIVVRIVEPVLIVVLIVVLPIERVVEPWSVVVGPGRSPGVEPWFVFSQIVVIGLL